MAEKIEWIPRTELGQRVVRGEFASLEDVLAAGHIILEPEIVDYLVPNLVQDIIYIGGSPGKGGGIKRTATRRTARMHKSGRRYKLAAVIVVGNSNGLVGLGRAVSKEHRLAIEKAIARAKLAMIPVKRGCGSWECGCGGPHSIPFRVTAKCGSVSVTLLPAPRGVGVVADGTSKKVLSLAGIKDVWVKVLGNTGARINLVSAVFEALKGLSRTKGEL